ncbi:hypothetical protein [Streptomyces sp. NBC_01363]|uniref:hypothetical protein n=1 Tax=Streptomyces sp. NBC_01363 TaxID=2903840 RepID=UPI002250ED8B|nr:hypothetical protein [Streptomyces sp. NBC_01363]MCX4734100.1 hypothetical protein [Streptomyces sp. NBC_01363]
MADPASTHAACLLLWPAFHRARVNQRPRHLGGGARERTETVSTALAAFEADCLNVNESLHPQALPATGDNPYPSPCEELK